MKKKKKTKRTKTDKENLKRFNAILNLKRKNKTDIFIYFLETKKKKLN